MSGRAAGPGNIGGGWAHSFLDLISVRPATAKDSALAILTASDGTRKMFSAINGTWTPLDSADQLVQTNQGWTHTSNLDNSTRQFDANGKVISHTQRNGWTYHFAYDTQGHLARVTNHFGRQLDLARNSSGQLMGVSLGAQVKATYEYDAAQRLALVRYPDNSTKVLCLRKCCLPPGLDGYRR